MVVFFRLTEDAQKALSFIRNTLMLFSYNALRHVSLISVN